MENLKKAIKNFSEINPVTTEDLYLRGNVYLKIGGSQQNQLAVDDFTKALVSKSDNDAPMKVPKAIIYYKRAFAHQMLQEYHEAIKDFTEFISRATPREDLKLDDSAIAKGYISRGLVYESMQLLEKALEDINKAIRLQEDRNPFFEYCRQRIEIRLNAKKEDPHDKDERESESEDEETTKDSNDYTSPHESTETETTADGENKKYEKCFYHGLCLSEKKQYTKAASYFEKALKYATNNSQTKAECLFRQGLCEYELANKVHARELFQKASTADKSHARAIFRLGMMEVKARQYEKALHILTEANTRDPNDPAILYERANVNEKLGRLDEAISDRRLAMQLKGSISEIVILLEDHLRRLKVEILQKGETALGHLKMGWIYETLHRLFKKNKFVRSNTKETESGSELHTTKYVEAVSEYVAAIANDVDHSCPEAYALLGFCHESENSTVLANESILNFYEMVNSFPESLETWKVFVQMIKTGSFLNELGSNTPERVIIQIQKLDGSRELIRRHEEILLHDETKNRLWFYKKLRIQLSNVLAAFALAGCSKEVLQHNLKGKLNT